MTMDGANRLALYVAEIVVEMDRLLESSCTNGERRELRTLTVEMLRMFSHGHGKADELADLWGIR